MLFEEVSKKSQKQIVEVTKSREQQGPRVNRFEEKKRKKKEEVGLRRQGTQQRFARVWCPRVWLEKDLDPFLVGHILYAWVTRLYTRYLHGEALARVFFFSIEEIASSRLDFTDKSLCAQLSHSMFTRSLPRCTNNS